FRERQPAQRFADHDAGVGDHGIEPAEVFDEHFYRAGNRSFLADIAFDQNNVANARRKCALQPAARRIDDADAPTRREQVMRDGAADAVGAAGHQRHGFRYRHAGDSEGMIPKKPAPDLIRSGYRFSEKIMPTKMLFALDGSVG